MFELISLFYPVYVSRGPLFKPCGRICVRHFLDSYIESSKMFFSSNLFALWQETLADARDGDGGDHVGPFWINFKIISTPCWDNFKTILGSPMSENSVFQPNQFL